MIPGAEYVYGLPEPRPGHPVRPISISEVELSAPGPTEILIRLEAAEICHSDLNVVDGDRVRPAAGRAELSLLTITAEARTVTGSYLGSASVPRHTHVCPALAGRETACSGAHFRAHRPGDINAAMDQLADGRAVRQVITFDAADAAEGKDPPCAPA
jgi:Zn-dependent alcohol dehydrogenase